MQTDKNYEYRLAGLEDKWLKLSSVFAIDVAVYAIMSNHYHAVLHINVEREKRGQILRWWSVDICYLAARSFHKNT
jgi:hypothetical protein